jgi:Iap family predicted aminopeptidase
MKLGQITCPSRTISSRRSPGIMIRLSALLLALFTSLAMVGVSVAQAAPSIVAVTRTALALEARAYESSGFLLDNAPAFSGPSAYQHVQALAVGIGSRMAGSPAQTQTQQYLMDQYRQLGYQVELQPFTITAYQDRGSSVALSGGGGQSVQANTIQYSVGGSVEAELVEAGLGRAEDYEDAGVAGKVALVTRGDTRFDDKVKAATAAGAVAVVIGNNDTGNFNGSLLSPSTIPAVSVSKEDATTLRQAIRAGGATVQVSVNASSEQSTGANVVATRPGGPHTVVVGAHMDSVAAGPGANDNGSGTAVVLELARVMATRPTPFTLTFVDFDAEEIGLIGSRNFVSQLSTEQQQAIVGMINLDMVGVGDRSLVGGTDQMVRLAQAAASQKGLSLGTMGEAGASDHASFMRAGIPSLFVYRSNDPNYHSPNDLAQYVDPANLQIAGDLALDVIGALERGE